MLFVHACVTRLGARRAGCLTIEIRARDGHALSRGVHQCPWVPVALRLVRRICGRGAFAKTNPTGI